MDLLLRQECLSENTLNTTPAASKMRKRLRSGKRRKRSEETCSVQQPPKRKRGRPSEKGDSVPDFIETYASIQQPPKRKRGRPSEKGDNVPDSIQTDISVQQPPKRKRGRPRKSTSTCEESNTVRESPQTDGNVSSAKNIDPEKSFNHVPYGMPSLKRS